MTDNKQQQQLDEASQKFADAVKGSYEAIARRGASAQEVNTDLTRNFFNGVINNLQNQAEGNRALTRELAEQQQRQREATQALTQESLNAYTDFLNSMFSYYRGGLEQTKANTKK